MQPIITVENAFHEICDAIKKEQVILANGFGRMIRPDLLENTIRVELGPRIHNEISRYCHEFLYSGIIYTRNRNRSINSIKIMGVSVYMCEAMQPDAWTIVNPLTGVNAHG